MKVDDNLLKLLIKRHTCEEKCDFFFFPWTLYSNPRDLYSQESVLFFCEKTPTVIESSLGKKKKNENTKAGMVIFILFLFSCNHVVAVK